MQQSTGKKLPSLTVPDGEKRRVRTGNQDRQWAIVSSSGWTHYSSVKYLHPGKLTAGTQSHGGLEDDYPFQLGEFEVPC